MNYLNDSQTRSIKKRSVRALFVRKREGTSGGVSVAEESLDLILAMPSLVLLPYNSSESSVMAYILNDRALY